MKTITHICLGLNCWQTLGFTQLSLEECMCMCVLWCLQAITVTRVCIRMSVRACAGDLSCVMADVFSCSDAIQQLFNHLTNRLPLLHSLCFLTLKKSFALFRWEMQTLSHHKNFVFRVSYCQNYFSISAHPP